MRNHSALETRERLLLLLPVPASVNTTSPLLSAKLVLSCTTATPPQRFERRFISS
jgi:hypothetical protein